VIGSTLVFAIPIRNCGPCTLLSGDGSISKPIDSAAPQGRDSVNRCQRIVLACSRIGSRTWSVCGRKRTAILGYVQARTNIKKRTSCYIIYASYNSTLEGELPGRVP
jgi:hypothetical protein